MNKKVKYLILLIFASMTLFINVNKVENNEKIKINKITNENPFHDLGYSKNDQNIIKNKLSDEQLQAIIERQIPRHILFSFIKHKGFVFENLKAYEEIRVNKKVSHNEAVNYYNHPYLFKEFYKHRKKAINIETNLVLVNKNYYLDSTYVPKNLVYSKDLNLLIPNDDNRNYLEKQVYLALKGLFTEAETKNMYIFLSNGFRSFSKQDRIYHQLILEGQNADMYSARAGHSEHQTGLAVDITCKSVKYLLVQEFEYTKEGIFIKHNAHKYGFIIRYPINKENITGYNYEPWHLRYVGEEIATIIYQQNLTLEEYLLKYTEMPI